MHLPHDAHAILDGVFGALWLAGLWVAAPAVGRAASGSQRLAAMLALGVAIPLALGCFDLLYGWSLWIVLVAAIALRLRRTGPHGFGLLMHEFQAWDVALGFAIVVALAWPVAVRPVMDGDTLIYHLPNAAGWVTHHSIWTTGTRYWWYPPASEIFASSLLAIGGAGVVGWAGLLPAALLITVARETAVRAGSPPVIGTLTACALLATPVAAAQLVSLQNDLWLTALFVCALTQSAPAAVGALALTKPYGFVFAITAAVTNPDRKRMFVSLAVAAGAITLWILRDALLVPNAVVPIASTTIPNAFQTTIAANIPRSLAVLGSASLHAGIFWTLGFSMGLVSIVLSRTRALALAAFLSALIFAMIPTAYEAGTVRQLATGASLRFALPIVALGMIWLLGVLPKAKWIVAAVAAAAVVAGTAAQWQLYFNDATTHDTPIIVAIVALAGICLACLRSQPLRTVAAALLMVGLGSLAAGLARSHPDDYVRDRYGGAAIFAVSHANGLVVTLGIPAGAVAILDPNVRVVDGLDAGTCAQAKELGAVIVTIAPRMAALGCGKILYQDSTSVVLGVN